MKLKARLRSQGITAVILGLLVVVAVVQLRNPSSYLVELVSRVSDGTRTPAPVHEISNIGQLQTRFNADQGHSRLILLLSPT